MGPASQQLLALRPVTFRYNQASSDGTKPIQYGLIAEELAEVYPDLVVYDKDGQVQTVQYHKLVPMLLNELQQARKIVDRAEETYTRQAEQITDQTERITQQSEKITQQAKQIAQERAQNLRQAEEIRDLKAQNQELREVKVRLDRLESMMNSVQGHVFQTRHSD